MHLSMGYPIPMDDRPIYLPWDKNFGLTPLGQTVVYREYGKFTEICKGIRRYPSMSIPPGAADTEKIIHWGYDTLIKWIAQCSAISVVPYPPGIRGASVVEYAMP